MHFENRFQAYTDFRDGKNFVYLKLVSAIQALQLADGPVMKSYLQQVFCSHPNLYQRLVYCYQVGTRLGPKPGVIDLDEQIPGE